MAEPWQAEFVLEGNRFIARGEVGPSNEAQYAEALFKLLETGSKELVIDLTGLDRLSSAYVGSICVLALAAKQGKRSVLVIASPSVGRILTMSGLSRLTEVRIKGEEPAAAEYVIDGNTLVVRGNVFDDEIGSLQAAARKLLETKHSDLVIDMSRVGRIRGSHLVVLAQAMADAGEEGRTVTIAAAESVRSLLDAAKLCSLGEVRIVSSDSLPRGPDAARRPDAGSPVVVGPGSDASASG